LKSGYEDLDVWQKNRCNDYGPDKITQKIIMVSINIYGWNHFAFSLELSASFFQISGTSI